MRRAKDANGNPLPITEQDREEFRRFEAFLNEVHTRQTVLGSSRRDAELDAYEAQYPGEK